LFPVRRVEPDTYSSADEQSPLDFGVSSTDDSRGQVETKRRAAVSYVVGSRFRVGSAISGVVLLASVWWVASSAAALPNPCTLLANAHAGTAFGHGKTLPLGAQKTQHYGTGKYAGATCLTSVGSQQVSLNLSGGAGGFGGVKITSQTHPSGLGAGATLTVGTGLGKGGGAVDFVSFHRGPIYAVVSANGASPAVLTSFARVVYRELP
jgi:hypothetical protein